LFLCAVANERAAARQANKQKKVFLGEPKFFEGWIQMLETSPESFSTITANTNKVEVLPMILKMFLIILFF
jgi:hypothetical protein